MLFSILERVVVVGKKDAAGLLSGSLSGNYYFLNSGMCVKNNGGT